MTKLPALRVIPSSQLLKNVDLGNGKSLKRPCRHLQSISFFGKNVGPGIFERKIILCGEKVTKLPNLTVLAVLKTANQSIEHFRKSARNSKDLTVLRRPL
jgi:hypothetical protein